MKTRIIIAEDKITKAGEWRLFQIRLPKNTKRIVAVASDIRIISHVHFGDPGSPGDMQWNIPFNPLAGKLILQSMEKANIFFYDQLWSIQFNDGISDLDKVDSMNAFSVIKKPEAKKVDVPYKTTIINALYADSMGADLATDVTYMVKVLLWIEYDETEM